MANKESVLDKIVRNMLQRGISAERSGAVALVDKDGTDKIEISYVEKNIQKPMGGVDGQVSPFLGIGVAAPGYIQVKSLKAADISLALLFAEKNVVELLVELAGYANDIKIMHSNGTTELLRIRSNETVLGLGS